MEMIECVLIEVKVDALPDLAFNKEPQSVEFLNSIEPSKNEVFVKRDNGT
jgi:hypothetical protein